MITIRPTTSDDSLEILHTASKEPLFSQEETSYIAELLLDYYQRDDPNGYLFLTALFDDQIVGFACYGPTPLTQGTFDLYWISVSADYKERGIDRLLIQQVIQRSKVLDGRLLLAETSSRKDYSHTCFLRAAGFYSCQPDQGFFLDR